MKKIWILIAALLVLSGCGSMSSFSGEAESKVSTEKLQGANFTFFDVGQGDSTLIEADDGTTILIDTGRSDDKRILTYLEEKNS
ncbi:late competence protein [Listeria fleischmannii FSL S10-1203]|uniref:Late competence protein n=1 Tax=Listeria fleischmannii FSL S10-1203 TaxID=1265822 RepID=W7DPT6_9LIST|nr:late competence protein [Listeria fleischmannii FSL S10-1203]